MEQLKTKEVSKNSWLRKLSFAVLNFAVFVLVSILITFLSLGATDQIADFVFVVLQWTFLLFAFEGSALIVLAIVFYFFEKKSLAKRYLSRGIILVVFSLFFYIVVVFISTPIEKPVIYLYPTEKTDVNVRLDFNGKIIADYPSFNEAIKGWEVEAHPDGKIVNKSDGKEYSYLFWEGEPETPINWSLKEGFVVKGEDTREFLQQTLSEMGLTPREYNEFIVYWYPLMKNNPYNLIYFAGEEYTNSVELIITPKPDSMLRVFMVYKPLKRKVDIQTQKIKYFERKGFTVVEWGGTKVR